MKQIEVRPQTLPPEVIRYFESIKVNLDDHFAGYFATVTDSTPILTQGILPCIGGLFYRPGHLGLGHFDPELRPLLEEISSNVAPRMNSYGTGEIGCRFFTGYGFEARPSGGREYDWFCQRMAGSDLHFDEEDSRLLRLLNGESVWPIAQLQARLIGDNLSEVEVQVKYTYGSHETFSIEMKR